MRARRASLTPFAVGAGLALATPHCRADHLSFGEYLASECTACHRLDGDQHGIPPIVGWSQEAFVVAMNEFRDGVRTNPVMQSVARALSNEEIGALAAYFAQFDPVGEPQ